MMNGALLGLDSKAEIALGCFGSQKGKPFSYQDIGTVIMASYFAANKTETKQNPSCAHTVHSTKSFLSRRIPPMTTSTPS